MIQNKITIVSICLLLVGFSQGQDISTSPYSAFGIGDVLSTNTVEQSAMGGLSTAVETPFYSTANFSNPATNKNLNLTVFNFSLSNENMDFSSDSADEQDGTTYVSQISLAFPISEKTKLGFSFQPYTATGYDIVNNVTVEDSPNFLNDFEGDGGLNSLSFIGSRNIGKNLSVGAKVNYIFGDIVRTETTIVEGLELLTRNRISDRSNGFQFSTGGFYSKKLKKNKSLNIGLNYTFTANLDSDFTDLTTTSFPVNNIEFNLDTIRLTEIKNGRKKIPQELSVGVSLAQNRKWLLGAQFDYGNWDAFEKTGSVEDNIYRNSYRTSVGGYWLPNFNGFKSYFERVTYRAGLYYESTPLRINNTGINQFGITFGMSFPVGKVQNPSKLDFSFELGQRGTTDNNLIRERFANVRVGFNLNARWFQKRIYD